MDIEEQNENKLKPEEMDFFNLLKHTGYIIDDKKCKEMNI